MIFYSTDREVLNRAWSIQSCNSLSARKRTSTLLSSGMLKRFTRRMLNLVIFIDESFNNHEYLKDTPAVLLLRIKRNFYFNSDTPLEIFTVMGLMEA